MAKHENKAYTAMIPAKLICEYTGYCKKCPPVQPKAEIAVRGRTKSRTTVETGIIKALVILENMNGFGDRPYLKHASAT